MAGDCTIIGFDADAAECQCWNQSSTNLKMFPAALDATSGVIKDFFIAVSADCCGFRQLNETYRKRFALMFNYMKNKITLQTTALDDWAKKEAIERINFIKVDTEGTEVDILRGATESLRTKKCLGVLSEVWFEPDVKVGSGYGFAALDILLQGLGFRFFDIAVRRWPCFTMPVGHLKFTQQPNGRYTPSHTDTNAFGQALMADVLYFRDPIAEMLHDESTAREFWDEETVLRLLVLLDLYNYQDFALEILSFFDGMFDQATLNKLVNALLPLDLGAGAKINLSFSDYWNISSQGCKAAAVA